MMRIRQIGEDTLSVIVNRMHFTNLYIAQNMQDIIINQIFKVRTKLSFTYCHTFALCAIWAFFLDTSQQIREFEFT